ncbi:MAG: hypothetical protein ACR5K7_05970 [Symbiopectobacterium sp.]
MAVDIDLTQDIDLTHDKEKEEDSILLLRSFSAGSIDVQARLGRKSADRYGLKRFQMVSITLLQFTNAIKGVLC